MENEPSTTITHNNAKFAFFYLISMVALGFLAASVGNILFQIINKNVSDVIDLSRYSSGALRFAISAIIVAAPIYYLSVWQINKHLFAGVLHEDAGVRKWLTYLVLLISSVTIIGDLIAAINNFLNGELTMKFFLKILTILVIAGVIFAYYLYDIKREQVRGEKSQVISIFFYASLAAVVIVFISAFFFVESPAEARLQRLDREVVNRLSQVESGIQNYFSTEGVLPETLSDLVDGVDFIQNADITNPVTDTQFEYAVTGENEYELCTEFKSSNKDTEDLQYEYLNDYWQHEAGRDCVKKKVADYGKAMPAERF